MVRCASIVELLHLPTWMGRQEERERRAMDFEVVYFFSFLIPKTSQEISPLQKRGFELTSDKAGKDNPAGGMRLWSYPGRWLFVRSGDGTSAVSGCMGGGKGSLAAAFNMDKQSERHHHHREIYQCDCMSWVSCEGPALRLMMLDRGLRVPLQRIVSKQKTALPTLGIRSRVAMRRKDDAQVSCGAVPGGLLPGNAGLIRHCNQWGAKSILKGTTSVRGVVWDCPRLPPSRLCWSIRHHNWWGG